MVLLREAGVYFNRYDLKSQLPDMSNHKLLDIVGYLDRGMESQQSLLICTYSEEKVEKYQQMLEFCPQLKVIQKNEIRISTTETVKYFQVDSGALKLTTTQS